MGGLDNNSNKYESWSSHYLIFRLLLLYLPTLISTLSIYSTTEK